jgi:hypothetical protein
MSMAQTMMIFVNYLYLFFLIENLDQGIKPHPDWVMMCMSGSAVIAFILSFFIREELRRMSSVLDISITSAPSTPKLQYR